MTATTSRLTAARRDELVAECERLAALTDVELATRLLASTPTHEARDPALLARWAELATGYGAGLARGGAADGISPAAVECEGGIERGLLARYLSRPVSTVELYVDAIELGEELSAFLGWQEWFPPGSLRAAALAHEQAHARLHDTGARRALRHRLGHVSLSLGRFRFFGHVAGADEVAAHGYAGAAVGLGRTPILLTAALTSAVLALREG
ncbi:hypothetical protein LZ318_21045 [Saccharopolyspora indica]|uniref:hypothetical protein n=1 Tax=Saccharopolyspora indica TaxID=1229659 RepID=UPI0022EA2694|nr:hypothetical protein [Saccharopolyspora indica]MDA3642435.1 hypothetical protein [Saccharopolyspora indica]